MHSDLDHVRKSVRSYIVVFVLLMVFTIATVAVAGLRVAVPVHIGLALIIAIVKGGMVAGVFMHLNHEKRWIYGTLVLTVVFFVVLLLLPVVTSLDSISAESPWVR